MSVQGQIDYFEDLLSKHGDSYLALDWNSPQSQRLRFEVLREIFIYGRKAHNISVLDLGCGFGDLFGFFKVEKLLKNHKIHYTGYDIAPKIIQLAKKKYSDARFEVKDILQDRHVPSFDYVFASGIFNIRTNDVVSHLEQVKNMLLRMYDLANCGIAVNFLSEGALPLADPQDVNSGQYFYFKPEEILNFARFVCSRYVLRHDYHPGDFTVFMLK